MQNNLFDFQFDIESAIGTPMFMFEDPIFDKDLEEILESPQEIDFFSTPESVQAYSEKKLEEPSRSVSCKSNIKVEKEAN